MKTFTIIIAVLIILLFTSYCPAQDVEDSKDHPMFNRLSGFYIADYSVQNFSSHLFCDENDNEIIVKVKQKTEELS